MEKTFKVYQISDKKVFLIDLTLDDKYNSHRYYILAKKDGEIYSEKIKDIDYFIDFLEHNNLTLDSLNDKFSKNVLKVFFAFVREYNKKKKNQNADLKKEIIITYNDTSKLFEVNNMRTENKDSLKKYYNTSQLHDYDLKLINKYEDFKKKK